MLAAESAGVVYDEAVSEWFQKHLPTSPSEKARGDAGVLPDPRLVASGRWAPAAYSRSCV
jgi:hypothetical protein